MDTQKQSDELTAQERELLRSLSSGAEVPPHLEDAVVGVLRQRGLIRSERGISSRATGWLFGHWRAALAASVLFVAGIALGYAAGRTPTTSLGSGTGEARFILILLEGDGNVVGGDHEGLKHEYASWAESVRASGRWITGAPLEDTGLRLVATDTGTRNLFPAEEDLRITGYFMFTAANEEDARRTTLDCPHLKLGGMVELRRIAG